MSNSPKETSTGYAYIKKINGNNIVHIEPSPSCKVPKKKWVQVLKNLKSTFGGLKAVVVIAGEVLDAIQGDDENEVAQPNTDQPTEQDAAQPQVDPMLDSVKNLIKELAADLKGGIKDVTKNVKRKKTTTEDLDFTDLVLDKFNELQESFAEMADDTREKLQANYEAIVKFLPQVEQLKTILDGSRGDNEDDRLDPETRKFLRQLRQSIRTFPAKFQKHKDKAQNTATEGLAGGDEFVEVLF